MITLKRFIKRIENATSKAFIGNDENDEQWVIRPKFKVFSSKRLFNEFFSGKLGEELGISRPPVELMTIELDINNHFNEELDYESLAVATKYLDDIKSIPSPPNSDCNDDNFPRVNAKYLRELFGNDYNFEDFYSYRVYAAWIYLEDYWKYDNLHININSKKPVFIDFDFAFKGVKWSELPTEYVDYKLRSRAFFLDGVIPDINRYEKYFGLIKSIDRNKYTEIINRLPANWNIPKEFKDNLINLLFGERDHFVEQFLYLYEK